MNADSKTLILIATYNEIENLPILVDAIFFHLPEVHVLVVDDDSPDGTGRWCDRMAPTLPGLRCIHRVGRGLGTAVIDGLRYAIQQRYTLVVNMDADFSHHPQFIASLVDSMDPTDREPVDVAVASRYTPGGGVDGWPWHRHLMSRAVNWYARRTLGLRVRDCSGSFRCYRVAALARLDFDRFRSTGFSFFEEILFRLRQSGAEMAELPYVFVDREHGTSKINRRAVIDALKTIWQLGRENRRPS